MTAFLNSNKKLFTFLFFLTFFLIGLFIFPDYGIPIDEDNIRIVGFLNLESIYKIFAPEHVAKIDDFITGQRGENLNLDVVPSTGAIFDLPMSLLELIFQINDSRQYFLLRHFLLFLLRRIFIKYIKKTNGGKNNPKILALIVNPDIIENIIAFLKSCFSIKLMLT